MIDKGRKPRVICKREQVLLIEKFDILVTQHFIIATVNNNRSQDKYPKVTSIVSHEAQATKAITSINSHHLEMATL